MAKDLVCGREVETHNAHFQSEYGDGRYYFCSRECQQKFDDHPDGYIAEAQRQLG